MNTYIVEIRTEKGQTKQIELEELNHALAKKSVEKSIEGALVLSTEEITAANENISKEN